MRRLSDRFGEAASTCPSLSRLKALLGDAASELGFTYFALLHHASLLHPRRRYVRIDNYPSEWVNELVCGGLARHDPVHRASARSASAFPWTHLPRLVPLGPREEKILERSRAFGLGDGLTVPVHVPGEPAGSCSFATRAGIELPADRLLCAELIGLHAFTAARRIADWPSRRARPNLSRRELQCLRLVAAGKSDWEIARILGIDAETVRQYVKHARSVYGVVTRTQLVVWALADEWLSLDEALDARD
jgi:LuxR family quorum-sensing system transcriptional regulator CciR